jgi:hypothetical protein
MRIPIGLSAWHCCRWNVPCYCAQLVLIVHVNPEMCVVWRMCWRTVLCRMLNIQFREASILFYVSAVWLKVQSNHIVWSASNLAVEVNINTKLCTCNVWLQTFQVV